MDSAVKDIRKSARQVTSLPAAFGLPEYLKRHWHPSTSSEGLGGDSSLESGVTESVVSKESSSDESGANEDIRTVFKPPPRDECSEDDTDLTKTEKEPVPVILLFDASIPAHLEQLKDTDSCLGMKMGAGDNSYKSSLASHDSKTGSNVDVSIPRNNVSVESRKISTPAGVKDEQTLMTIAPELSKERLCVPEGGVSDCFIPECSGIFRNGIVSEFDHLTRDPKQTAVVEKDSCDVKSISVYQNVMERDGLEIDGEKKKLIDPDIPASETVRERADETLVLLACARQSEITAAFPVRKRRRTTIPGGRKASGEKLDGKKSRLNCMPNQQSRALKVASLAHQRSEEKRNSMFSRLKSQPQQIPDCVDAQPMTQIKLKSQLQDESKVEIDDQEVVSNTVEHGVKRSLEPEKEGSVAAKFDPFRVKLELFRADDDHAHLTSNSSSERITPTVKHEDSKAGAPLCDEGGDVPHCDEQVKFNRLSYEDSPPDVESGSGPSPLSSVIQEEDTSGSLDENNSTGSSELVAVHEGEDSYKGYDVFTEGDVNESQTGFDFRIASNDNSLGSSCSMPNYEHEELENLKLNDYDRNTNHHGGGDQGGRHWSPLTHERCDQSIIGKSRLFDAEMMLVAMASQPRAVIEEGERGVYEQRRRNRVHRSEKMSSAESTFVLL